MLIINNPDSFRNNIRENLNQIITNDKISVNLEKAIFNYSIRRSNEKNIVKRWDNIYFVQLYTDKLRSIINNIDPKYNKKNKSLLNKLKKSKILPQNLAFMSHQEMNPKLWKKLIDAKIKRDKNCVSTDMSAATDEFTCFKCKTSKCTYYQLQTRSADEPMTTFVMCLNCGNRWKC
uniref:TFIIS-type domain-containing protein n=1 Tax=viral metagenome TaxID=1070528 RepID=A0A6C0C2X1_9ZZZZ